MKRDKNLITAIYMLGCIFALMANEGQEERFELIGAKLHGKMCRDWYLWVVMGKGADSVPYRGLK